MEKLNVDNIQRFYFIGIGGIGMSALARYFNGMGKSVYGYDKTATRLTKTLEAEGMKIHYEDNVSLIPDNIELVVYTPAVPDDHAELLYLRANGYTVLKRAEVLGLISRTRKTIAVAGTHGKTSTSSLLSWLLTAGDLKCGAFLGGIARNFDSNFVAGEGEWLVVEADEYDRSFLHLRPRLAIILSMDADHLDIYGSHDAVKKSFGQFADCVQEGGKIFLNSGLELGHEHKGVTVNKYGILSGNYRAENIRIINGMIVFDVKSPKGDIFDLEFLMPGLHNVGNATAAIAVAQELGMTGAAIKKALKSFKGIQRRFEWICRGERIYIDDYAHHPTELEAAIQAVNMMFPGEEITGIFQPHLFSRTQDFADDFAAALDKLDVCYLLEIYPAREKPIPGVDSSLLLSKMKSQNKQLVSKEKLLQLLRKQKPKILISLGAGDIGAMVDRIKKTMTE